MNDLKNAKTVFEYIYDEAKLGSIYMAELIGLIKNGCSDLDLNKNAEDIGRDLFNLLSILLGKGGFVLYRNILRDGKIETIPVECWKNFLKSETFREVDDIKEHEIEFLYLLRIADQSFTPIFSEHDFESIHLD